MFDSHFMPRPTPDSTENRTNPVMIPMRIAWLTIDVGTTFKNSRPALIWMTPRPSDVATPKSVPTSAATSMAFPHPPCTSRAPRIGSSAHRIVRGRWRRWKA